MNIKKNKIYQLIFGHKKINFILEMEPNSNILDVGCGNHSPSFYKRINPHIKYYGLDIAEYNMDEIDYKSATKIMYVGRSEFANSIREIGNNFDAVIASHTLEHTDEPFAVLLSMIAALRKGGKVYLSFPTEDSKKFPSRKGTLNFYDDLTHNYLPEYNTIIETIEKCGAKIIFSRKRYRYPYGFIKGLLQEPLSRLQNKNYPDTWSFWGFETVIIAEKC
ncbi:MAG: methyltransferase domain-containing protein [Sphingobacteriia bacterium]|nr:methyltransferase domain-containing protein [Sphingobacteriia bacterium]